MTEPCTQTEQAVPSGWRQLFAFVFLSLLWSFGLLLASSVLLPFPMSEEQAAAPSPFTLGLSGLGVLGFVGLAYCLAASGSRARYQVFAWRRTSLQPLVASLAVGLCLAPFGSWFAECLIEHFEVFSAGHLEDIARLLCEGSLGGRAVAMTMVLLVAPLAEELLFRGFIWDCLEREMGRRAAWLLSSLLFSLYHVDPLHVVSVFPLSLLLGVLRLRTGSVLPSIAAHFGNNLLSVLLLLLIGIEGDLTMHWAIALLCVTVAALTLLSGYAFQTSAENVRE